MSDAPTKLVRFVRNADQTVATGALSFPDDDRPDLVVGGAGYVTDLELQQAAALGVVLEPTNEEKLGELGIAVPDEPGAPDEPAAPNADLEGATKSDLESIATTENVDLSGAKNNEERAGLIRDARAAQPEGEASLPATAGAGPGAPVAPSTLSGSGPGATAGSPGAGTGTSGTGTSGPA